jgi:hypothetical protein
MRPGPPGSVVAEPATADGAPRRRGSWSLPTIVEDVSGRPLEDWQDPARPLHPYMKGRAAVRALPPRPLVSSEGPEPYDPVGHFFPPLVGATGRRFHGTEYEHHSETLARHGALAAANHPAPLRRPEQIYLHYLLLHMDRLSDTALRYLRTVLDEEMAHRSPPSGAAAGASTSVTQGSA